MVASPPSDNETMNDESLTEIPLSSYRQSPLHNRSVLNNYPEGSTVYIASGQFTVSKITAPPHSFKEDSNANVFTENAKQLVNRGVGSPRKNNLMSRRSESDTEDSSLGEENDDDGLFGKVSRTRRVRFAEDSSIIESRKIKL